MVIQSTGKGYRHELADAIREAVAGGDDGVTLGPTDALIAAEALQEGRDRDSDGNIVRVRPTQSTD